jgi:hypothetical protein
LSESSFTCHGLRASGLTRRLFIVYTSGVIVSEFTSSELESRLGQTKDYIDIKLVLLLLLSMHHSEVRSKDLLTLNQDNVSRVEQYFYLGTVVLVSQYYQNPTNHVGLVQSGHYHHLIEM